MLPSTILLASADDSTAINILTCLVQAGYRVIHSTMGAGIVDMVQRERPALVILDINLPDFSSLAIVRSLRQDGASDRLPVIIVGSNMREEDALIGLEVGADLCLLETFHPQVFVARIHSLLRRYELKAVH
jgi:DNA-binding response OmpR family regulator